MSPNKKQIAIIGGGISGIAAARMLQGQADAVVFEKSDKIGGLIRCDILPQGLYHKLGGHVFNTKSPLVGDWFWRHFDRDLEFHKINRDAKILLDSSVVGYPIENHLYQLPAHLIEGIVRDLLALSEKNTPSLNFKEFLSCTFGESLCEAYFYPYNNKLWRQDLSLIPIGWLEGKLPMPDVADILKSNILRKQENGMVHSLFYYPVRGGSQFVIDRLAEGVSVRLGHNIKTLAHTGSGRWIVNGDASESFDAVIYTGDIRQLSSVLPEMGGHPAFKRVAVLKTRGITNVFCECDHTGISWLYLPDPKFAANRIIYTGAFSSSNNGTARMTCVVEFNYGESNDAIDRDIRSLPGNVTRIAENHVRDAYVIQDYDTREAISQLRDHGRSRGLHFTGRFAEWEYYNIDKAIEAAAAAVEGMGYRGLCGKT